MKQYQEVVVGGETLRLPLVPSEGLGTHPVDCIINRLLKWRRDELYDTEKLFNRDAYPNEGWFFGGGYKYAANVLYLGIEAYMPLGYSKNEQEYIDSAYTTLRPYWSQAVAPLVWEVSHDSLISDRYYIYHDSHGIASMVMPNMGYVYKYGSIGEAQVAAFTDHCQRLADIMFGPES